MKIKLLGWLFCLFVVAAARAALAAAEPRPAEPDFSPPPVPAFMLKAPDQPLSLQQMQQQAEEAARRVRTPEPTSEPGRPPVDEPAKKSQ